MKMLRERILKVVTVLFIGSVFLLVGAAPASAQQDLVVRILKCPTSAKAGQELNAGFQVDAINGGRTAVKDVAVDIVLKKDVSCPVPTPLAVYSPNYSNGVLLKGGREYVSLNSGQLLNVKLNGTNTIPTDTPAGVYYLCAVIDAGNKIKEVNEPNNCACCPVKITTGAAKQGTTASASVTTSTAMTPAKGATPTAAIAGKSQATATKIVRQDVTSVKVSDAELNNFKIQKSTVRSPHYKIGGYSTTGETIEVISPKDGDTWEAGKEYGISWKRAGITGDVKIVLEKITIYPGGKPDSIEEYPIVERTANTGSYRFRVPVYWVPNPYGYHVRVSSLDGKAHGKSRGAIILPDLPPLVDLECAIVDAKIGEQKTLYYYKATEEEKFFEFNVLLRNKGSRSPIMINTILTRIIKEPEEVVCYQIEWGTGWMYHNEWYKTNAPIRFTIETWKHFVKDFGRDVDLKKGAYRVEVELDPQNRLNENEELRGDNKVVKKWMIR